MAADGLVVLPRARFIPAGGPCVDTADELGHNDEVLPRRVTL